MTPEFRPWPKITRLSKTAVVITEKLDGTNGCVVVAEDGTIHAQSRNRVITPQDDNYGFARWVSEHEDELALLGPGFHFGEWWGQGVQRGYGLDAKRFSLFDANRWGQDNTPSCVGVVPVLARTDALGLGKAVMDSLYELRVEGSFAAPGFDQPEGIVVTHDRRNFKVLLENDETHKGQVAA